MTTARSNIEVVAKAAVEAAPAYPSTIKQAVTTTAATDDGTINCGDGHRKKQSEVVGVQYAAVEAAPAHRSTMEQAVTAAAASDDEKDEIATINRCDGHSKTQ